MNNFFPFLDIIILGLLAIFLGFRLKGHLGDRSGYSGDLKNPDAVNKEERIENQNVIKLNNTTINGEGLDSLIKADPGFNEKPAINLIYFCNIFLPNLLLILTFLPVTGFTIKLYIYIILHFFNF